jgi:hypothetical protein
MSRGIPPAQPTASSATPTQRFEGLSAPSHRGDEIGCAHLSIKGFIMDFRRRMLSLAAIAGLIASPLLVASPATADDRRGNDRSGPDTELIADLGDSANGSTVGPDGALYVAVGAEGKVYRVNPRNGNTRVFAEDLPAALPGFGYGGVVDVAFRGHTAYVITTLIDEQFGGTEANGLYRIDDRDSHTLVADLSAFNRKYPRLDEDDPGAGELEGGNPFALESIRSGFLVTDGNLNRLFHISKKGKIRIVREFGDVVPTGLEADHRKIYMAEAGPVEAPGAVGKVISLNRRFHNERVVASGDPLVVDVEFSRCGRLYALRNGDPVEKADPGTPAIADTGEFLRVRNGHFKVLVDDLDQPVSVDFIRRSAYIVTLTGEIWRVSGFEKCGGHR